eukprot:symbB.v1.2.013431.t3/scaffold931.1/size151118/3
MDARFGGKDGLGGKLGAGKGKWQGSHKDGAVPVQIGLRVRNHANGHCGEVVACRGRTAGTFRVLSDNGQEWEWEVKRFVTEEGWPLQDVGEMPATIGMRIRCWMDNRTGRIAYIHNDWPQRIWVEFDDGEENEKDVTWFVCEEGGNPVGPGLTEKEWRYAKSGKSSPPQRALPARTTEYQSWSYQSSAGKGGHGMAQDWSSPSKGRSKDDFKDEYPPRARGGNAYSWNWEASKGKDGDRTQRRTGAAEKGKGPSHSYGGSSADLEEEALREVQFQKKESLRCVGSIVSGCFVTRWSSFGFRFQVSLSFLRAMTGESTELDGVQPISGVMQLPLSTSSPKHKSSRTDITEKRQAFGRRSCSQLSSTSALRMKALETQKSFTRPKFWVLAFGWFLAFCAGMVNTVSFRLWGVYVSHMTGTSTAIGLRLEGFHHDKHEDDILIQAVCLVSSFVLGSFTCGLLIDKNQVHFGGKSLYGAALVGNALLLGIAVGISEATISGCLSAAACGLQNAMCTSHFGAVVRTTHVTGTLTDIGSTLGRVAMSHLRRGCRRSRMNILDKAEIGVDLRKLVVLLPMWISFVLGSTLGAYCEHELGRYALLIPASFTLTLGLVYTLLRSLLKETWKRYEQERLNEKIKEVQLAIVRTGSRLAGQSSDNLQEIDEEMGEMLEVLSEVDGCVSHLCETPACHVPVEHGLEQFSERPEKKVDEDQVLDESNNGRVWITNWPGRFQAKLGQLREFLERHPDKFTVMAQGGRRYTVAFANANAAVKGSKEKGKGRAAPKKMEWKKSQKTDGDGDTAGESMMSMDCCWAAFYGKTRSLKEGPKRLDVLVHQLSGDLLCQLQVDEDCTIELLKHQIQSMTDIPQTRQHLMPGLGAVPLAEGAKVAEEAKEGRVELQIIQSFKAVATDVPKPRDGLVLRKAIAEKDVDFCLGLLTLDDLPGLNEKDHSDWTILHHAAWSGMKEVCHCILERADFTEANAHDISGLTALHCAACRGHLGAVLVLLAVPSSFTVVNSADAQIDRNGVGWSARDIAERYGHKHIVQAIDDADRSKRDRSGRTDASEKVPRSVRRSDEEDPDATAFDVEPAEDAAEAEAEEPEV